MEEKTLIQSEHYNLKLATTIFIIALLAICIIVVIGSCIYDYSVKSTDYLENPRDYKCEHSPRSYSYSQYLMHTSTSIPHENYASFLLCSKTHSFCDILFEEGDNPLKGCLIVFFLYSAIALFIRFALASYSLTVTDRRIYGKTTFGKRVDLPLDQISSVGMNLLKTISVGTSSGRIKFSFIKNRNEIHNVISDLLVKRQTQPKQQAINTPAYSAADELQKYKDLLDNGTITQEEFDAKKKQLLGL